MLLPQTTSRHPLLAALHPLALIDLLSFAPSLLGALLPSYMAPWDLLGWDLRWFRVFRYASGLLAAACFSASAACCSSSGTCNVIAKPRGRGCRDKWLQSFQSASDFAPQRWHFSALRIASFCRQVGPFLNAHVTYNLTHGRWVCVRCLSHDKHVCALVACRALRLLRLSLLSGNLSTMKTNRKWLCQPEALPALSASAQTAAASRRACQPARQLAASTLPVPQCVHDHGS